MSACDSSLEVRGARLGVDERGRIDATVEAVWPSRPSEVTPLSSQELAEACAVLAACLPGSGTSDADQARERADYLSTCVTTNAYEERAIPFGSNYFFSIAAADFLPGGGQASERWMVFARSVIATRGACDQIGSMLTPRPDEVACSDAGCWWYSTSLPIPAVSCEGDIAVLSTEGQSYRRDCSRALLACDPSSPTGCTDRAPAACSSGSLDRCDGTVKLGCDAYGRVTYHDCGWTQGGRCVEHDQGARCELDASPSCNPEEALCDGASLRVCAAGREVTVDCRALGFGACEQTGRGATCL